MKIGTIWCKLFGHKFVGTRQWLEGSKSISERRMSTFCTRCGITREELK